VNLSRIPRPAGRCSNVTSQLPNSVQEQQGPREVMTAAGTAPLRQQHADPLSSHRPCDTAGGRGAGTVSSRLIIYYGGEMELRQGSPAATSRLQGAHL
jgi:hypothetical protein